MSHHCRRKLHAGFGPALSVWRTRLGGVAGLRSVAGAVRFGLLCLAFSAMLANSGWSQVSGTDRIRFNVPGGELGRALDIFADQAGIQLLYDRELVAGKEAAGLADERSIDEGLALLLAGQDLQAVAEPGDPKAVRLIRGMPKPVADETPALDVTVTGTRLALDVHKYPGSVSLLKAEDLQSSNTVIGAMAEVPGVTLGGDMGRAMGQQYNIRGFGYQSEDRVIILQDGVRRSPSLYSNQISSFRSDNDLLKAVEIVKGASSVNHGGGAIGGVVAMTTKDAHDFLAPGRDMGMAAKVRYESNNYREGYVAGAIAPENSNYELLLYGKKGWHGDLTLAREYEVGAGVTSDKVDNDEDLRVFFVKGAYNFGTDARLALSYYDYHQDSEVTWQSLYHSAYSTVTGPVKGTLTQRDFVGTLNFAPGGSPWINLEVTGYTSAASYDRGYEYVAANGAQRKLDYENEDERWGVRAHNEMRFAAFGTRNRLLLGVDYENREEGASYVLDGTATVFGSMPNTYKDTGVYAHLETSLFEDMLIFQLSGRYDHFNRKVDANAGSYSNDNFSPRVGVAVRLFEGFHLLGNYSESFRAPTPHETSSEGPLNIHYWYLPNSHLKPETVREFETGFSYARTSLLSQRDRLQFKGMYFNGKIEDMIALKADLNGPTPPSSSYYATYENIDSVSREGVEVSASYDAERWGGRLGYSHLNQKNDATGKKTPQAFADKFTAGAYVRPLPSLRLGASVTHWFKPDQDPETVVSGGTTYWYVRDSFTHTNLMATWTPRVNGLTLLGRTPELVVGVNNLFDEPYINARDVETTSRVGRGRNVYVGFSTNF